jgi:hypothetical protein
VRAIGSALCVTASLLLAACGGGGGAAASGSAPTQQSGVLRLSTNNLTYKVALNDQTPAAVFTVSLDTVTTGEGEFTTQNQANIHVVLKAPYELSIGTHSDRVIVSACSTDSCSEPIANSQQTLTLTYTVTAAAAGNVPAIAFDATHFVRTGVRDAPPGVTEDAASITAPFTVTNFPFDANVFISAQTNTGIYPMGTLAGWSDLAHGSFQAFPIFASQIAPGVYHDTITVTACLDQGCVNPFPGSPFTLAIDYTVSNTSTYAGPGGYTYQVLHAGVGHIAWNATTQRIVATTSRGTLQQGLMSLSAPDGAADWMLPLDGIAGQLALSDDGQFAYVVSLPSQDIYKVRLADHTLVATLPFTAGTVLELQVAPGHADLLAIAYQEQNSDVADVELLDTATLASSTRAIAGFESELATIAWGASSSTLYAYDGYADLLSTFTPNAATAALGTPATETVDLNGTHLVDTGIHFAGGKLLENHGVLYDPASHHIVRSFALPVSAQGLSNLDYSSAILDAVTGRAYFRYENSTSTNILMEIHAFDVATGAEIGSASTWGYSPTDFIRWGANGLAAVDDAVSESSIEIVSGALVAP